MIASLQFAMPVFLTDQKYLVLATWGLCFGTLLLFLATAWLVGDNRRVSNEQRKRWQSEQDEKHSIRFRHGLQLNPPNAGLFASNPAEIWVANLGASSFLVQRVEIRRHDKRGTASPRWERFHPGEIWFDWDEVVQPGERRALPLDNNQGFWRDTPLAGVDVEVVVEISDSEQHIVRKTSGCFVKVRAGQLQPYRIEKGFGACWFPLCPECGTQVGMFQPKGLDSFTEVVANWIEPIQSDFARTCSQHVSDKLP
ncbi:MAG: hypothetical protein ACYCSN_11685 [Acidobacteriaceae bacterium]